MDNERDIARDLEPSAGDYAHAGVRVVLAMIPDLGGPLTEFFSMVIAPPLENRRDAWLIELFNRLKKLETDVDGFKIENLQKNENFISSLFYATQIAMRTHQQEKLEALRNAVINSISMPTVDENLQLMFLNLIDRYTPWHLKLLHFFREFCENSGSLDTNRANIPPLSYLRDAFGNRFPVLIGKQDFYEQIVKELVSQGLLEISSTYGKKMTDQKVVAFKITENGKRFLDFISNPEYTLENKL